ncbi:coagulase domain-containing protein [Staphylococcus hyicus]|uniref:coagulase domain-containing protein n=1 Tax=Staphylococcus hyicus TaxID=1284 RepID=UPI00057F1056|nr:coagulase domain-containing protein [Staphylococcus hyicus]AJC97036.1 coagulase-related protein [Staphylococcus hyicus]RTX70251.1 hypothetical protein EKQ60_00070 [Staphylococcus hyicus]SQE49411.1 secreted von Willebrand factor-binding protein precursor [Staphylococcus hyicus]
MKKKLLVLSASAILASNFIFDNNASALVKETKHKSEALKMGWNGYSQFSKKQYEDDFKDLTHRISLNEHGGFDEIEYKEAYQKYQDVFLGELDAFNQLILKLDSNEEGMTSQKYNIIREKLKQNKIEFITKVKEIESTKKDLKRFKEGDDDFYKAIDKVYELEDKVFMVMSSFSSRKNSDALDELYNKLFLIVGTTPEERLDKLPKNQRMLGEMCENLETIIDDFFKEIGYERPKDIVPLTDDNKDDFEARKKLREAALKANTDESFRDPNVKVRAEKAKAKLSEMTKKSSEAKAKAKAEAERKSKAASMPLKSYRNDPEAFPHKQLRNELSIKFPESSPQLPIYTVATESQPQPVLKQQTKEEKVDVLKSKRPETTLNGLNGESHFVTMDESSNASTQFGSNGHVFEYSFDSTPKTTNVAKQNVKQENYNSVNNLAGMSGESQHVDFTQDSNPSTTYGGYGNAFDFTEDTAPKQPETITESHEIVLDYQTHATMSGFKTGVSTEAYYSSNELTK